MALEMAAEASRTLKNSRISWNPLQVGDTDLPPNLLLMAKILVLCFFLTGQWNLLPQTFLPFAPMFDHMGNPVVLQYSIKILFVIAAACLLFNYRVRTACLTLGGLVMIAILSSRLYWQNNRTYTACLWFVAGLYIPGQKPWLARCQVILLYFGAALNKLLDADWRSGQFFQNMEGNLGHHQRFYIALSSLLPALWVAKIMSWTVIVVEFVIAGGFLVRTAWGPIAWLGIAYHTALLALTGYTFGMFYYATLSSFLAFVEWPLPSLIVSPGGPVDRGSKFLKLSMRFGIEKFFRVTSNRDGSEEICSHGICGGLRFSVGAKTYTGFAAVYMMLIYSPLTYFFFAILLSAPFPSAMLFHRLLAIIFLLFISPVLLAPAINIGSARHARLPVCS